MISCLGQCALLAFVCASACSAALAKHGQVEAKVLGAPKTSRSIQSGRKICLKGHAKQLKEFFTRMADAGMIDLLSPESIRVRDGLQQDLYEYEVEIATVVMYEAVWHSSRLVRTQRSKV